jgi:hypothetical protein
MRKQSNGKGQGQNPEFLAPSANLVDSQATNGYLLTSENAQPANAVDNGCEGGVCAVTWKPSRHAA